MILIAQVFWTEANAEEHHHVHSLIAEYDQYHQPPGLGGDHIDITPAYGLMYRFLVSWIGAEIGYSSYDVTTSGLYPSKHYVSWWSVNMVFPIEVTPWRRISVMPAFGIRKASSWQDDRAIYEVPPIDCVGCGDGPTGGATYAAAGVSAQLDVMEFQSRYYLSIGGQFDAMYKIGPFATHQTWPPEMRYSYGIRLVLSYGYSFTRHN